MADIPDFDQRLRPLNIAISFEVIISGLELLVMCKKASTVFPRKRGQTKLCDTQLHLLQTLGIVNEDEIQNTDDFLSDVNIQLGNHWQKMSGTKDPAVHYVLSQLIYRPDPMRGEVPYDLPDPDDIVKLLWCNRKAIGFYSVKPHGPRSQLENIHDRSGMPTLDTMFILPSHRRRGFGLSTLQDFVSSYPKTDLGFSQPISKSMWKVLKKFLEANEELRRKLWLIKDDCDEGNRTLIWFCLRKAIVEDDQK